MGIARHEAIARAGSPAHSMEPSLRDLCDGGAPDEGGSGARGDRRMERKRASLGDLKPLFPNPSASAEKDMSFTGQKPVRL
jgi:hypothetical protein